MTRSKQSEESSDGVLRLKRPIIVGKKRVLVAQELPDLPVRRPGDVRSFMAEIPSGVQPHTLILGTVPSPMSLSLRQFYGHPQNAFWRIAGESLGFDRKETAYRDQVAALNSAGFALWDVVESCSRATALDSDIRGAVVNDIGALLDAHPSIARLIFNGRKAADLFRRLCLPKLHQTCRPLGSIAADIFSRLESTSGSNTAGARELELCVLPSTSPAFTQSYEMKRDEWISLCFSRKI